MFSLKLIKSNILVFFPAPFEKKRKNSWRIRFLHFQVCEYSMSNTFCKMTLAIKNQRILFPETKSAIKLLLNIFVKNYIGDYLMLKYFFREETFTKNVAH